jgi:hypothetical protein
MNRRAALDYRVYILKKINIAFDRLGLDGAFEFYCNIRIEDALMENFKGRWGFYVRLEICVGFECLFA